MAPGINEDAKTPEVAVYLQEIVNPKSRKAPFREWGFKIERFRPLQELETEDIIKHTEAVGIEAIQ